MSRSVSREISPERVIHHQPAAPVRLPDVQKQVLPPAAPVEIPKISREECINELEKRMQVLGLDLGMSRLNNDEYRQKLQQYQSQRQMMWTGLGMYETKQYLANELESQTSIRSRHQSHGSNSNVAFDSPSRTKSLSQPNLNALPKTNEGNGILKNSQKSLGPSRTTLPSSQPSGLNQLPPSGGPASVKRKLLDSHSHEQLNLGAQLPEPAPRTTTSATNNENNENSWGDDEETEVTEKQEEEEEKTVPENNAQEPQVLTPRESEDESTAWDESQTKSIQSKKSVQYKDDFAKAEESEDEPTTATATPAINNNRSANDDEESEDDWMDDLDEALAKQGYGGL